VALSSTLSIAAPDCIEADSLSHMCTSTSHITLEYLTFTGPHCSSHPRNHSKAPSHLVFPTPPSYRLIKLFSLLIASSTTANRNTLTPIPAGVLSFESSTRCSLTLTP
jgi:hypothetical protein